MDLLAVTPTFEEKLKNMAGAAEQNYWQPDAEQERERLKCFDVIFPKRVERNSFFSIATMMPWYNKGRWKFQGNGDVTIAAAHEMLELEHGITEHDKKMILTLFREAKMPVDDIWRYVLHIVLPGNRPHARHSKADRDAGNTKAPTSSPEACLPSISPRSPSLPYNCPRKRRVRAWSSA